MNADPLTEAIAAWEQRREALNAIKGRDPYYSRKSFPQAVYDSCVALVFDAFGPSTFNKTVFPSCSCRRCKRGKVKGSLEMVLRHTLTIPHLSDEFGISPFILARAIRAKRIMAGDDPDAEKKPRKRRGKWNKNKTPEKAIHYAEQMLARWQDRERKAKAKVKEWGRRLRLAKKTQHAEQKDTP
jgi:hypothetical protein